MLMAHERRGDDGSDEASAADSAAGSGSWLGGQDWSAEEEAAIARLIEAEAEAEAETRARQQQQPEQ